MCRVKPLSWWELVTAAVRKPHGDESRWGMGNAEHVPASTELNWAAPDDRERRS